MVGNKQNIMRNFRKTRKEMLLASESSSPGTSCMLVQVQKRLGIFEKDTENPEGKWDELAKQVTEVYLLQKHPVLKGC